MKKLLFAVSALASVLTLGAADYVSFSFSTVGPDKYADGTTVLDGECYALVAAVGGFDGFNVDGTLKDAADKLLAALPLAKGGKCEPVIFNVDSADIPEGAELGIYLLDTRKFIEGKAMVQGLTGGKLAFVNAYEKTDVEVVAAGAGSTPTSGAGTAATDGTGAAGSILPANVPQPVIAKIDVLGESVVLTVTETVANVNYQIVGGATPASMNVLGEAKLGGGEIKLSFPREVADMPFIKVIRK